MRKLIISMAFLAAFSAQAQNDYKLNRFCSKHLEFAEGLVKCQLAGCRMQEFLDQVDKADLSTRAKASLSDAILRAMQVPRYQVKELDEMEKDRFMRKELQICLSTGGFGLRD